MSTGISNSGSLEAWLAGHEDPGVRYLALRDLVDTPSGDAQLQAARRAAHAEGPIPTILAKMMLIRGRDTVIGAIGGLRN